RQRRSGHRCEGAIPRARPGVRRRGGPAVRLGREDAQQGATPPMSSETDGDQTAMTAHEPVIGDDDLTIASIVESNGQMDYVAEVYRDHDKATVPEKQDYEFGQPVYVKTTVRGEE